VGYTQRLAGRNDFKEEMAQKISSGEMTPHQLVEEITLMAEEINMKTEVALSAAEEVERLLQETIEVARVLELPCGGEGSLSEFKLEEKDMVAVEVEREEAALPRFAVAHMKSETKQIGDELDTANNVQVNGRAEREEALLPRFAVADANILTEESVKVNGSMEREESITLPKFAVTYASSETNEINYESEVDSISDANNYVNGAKQHYYEEIADDIISHGIDEIDHDDPEVIADALLAEPPSARVEAESNELDEVEDALRLAQEALAFASESTQNSQIEEEETFMSPIPPSIEPPINLIKEGMKIEAKEEQTIRIDTKSRHAKTEEIRSSPLARLLCTELGVNLSDVPGTGLKGRVVADDVRKFAAAMSVSV
jgi:pyruvate/2-oxoglutarate dehydrogenase complex dihydrolipoamide acyltransferase (E2) component